LVKAVRSGHCYLLTPTETPSWGVACLIWWWKQGNSMGVPYVYSNDFLQKIFGPILTTFELEKIKALLHQLEICESHFNPKEREILMRFGKRTMVTYFFGEREDLEQPLHEIEWSLRSGLTLNAALLTAHSHPHFPALPPPRHPHRTTSAPPLTPVMQPPRTPSPPRTIHPFHYSTARAVPQSLKEHFSMEIQKPLLVIPSLIQLFQNPQFTLSKRWWGKAELSHPKTDRKTSMVLKLAQESLWGIYDLGLFGGLAGTASPCVFNTRWRSAFLPSGK